MKGKEGKDKKEKEWKGREGTPDLCSSQPLNYVDATCITPTRENERYCSQHSTSTSRPHAYAAARLYSLFIDSLLLDCASTPCPWGQLHWLSCKVRQVQVAEWPVCFHSTWWMTASLRTPDADDFDRPMSLRVSVEELAHTSLGDWSVTAWLDRVFGAT